MNKFEDITLLHIESSDYVGGALNPAITKEIDTADIVIDGGKVVKSRISSKENTRISAGLKTFRGLPLEPEGAFQNIATLINAALLIDVVESDDGSELSDCVLIIARQYAEAAHDYAMENRK